MRFAQEKRLKKFVTVFMACLILPHAHAFAACTNSEKGVPGASGDIEYFSNNELRYCDGTNWILMAEQCGGAQAACGGNPDQRVTFVSSNGSAGDFRMGGLLGADNSCTSEAIRAGISGVFYAWMADTDSNNDPVNRFEHTTVPYLRVDGTQIADDWADLVDCTGSCLDANLNKDENNATYNGPAWTNVATDGSAISYSSSNTCDGWTQNFGSPPIYGRSDDTNSNWTNSGTGSTCLNGFHRYCFEQQGNNAIALVSLSSMAQSPELNNVRNAAAWGNYGFVISASNSSISSIDMTDPMTSIIVADTYQDTTNMSGPRGLTIDGDYAYITSIGSNTLSIVDVSDPTNMVAPTGGNGGVLDDDIELATAYRVAVQGGYAYVAALGANQLVVIDVSDKATPVIANGGSAKVSIAGASEVAVEGDYAYVLSESTDTLTVVDISDPLNPSIATGTGSGTLTDSTNMDAPRSLDVQGNFAYVAALNSDSVIVVDVSDPTDPKIANGGSGMVTDNFYLDSVASIIVDGIFAYVAKDNGYANGVSIIDISDPLNPFVTANIRHDQSWVDGTYPLAKTGKYLLLGAQSDNVLIAHEIISNYAMGVPCSSTGEIFYDSSADKMVWCNGSNLIPMNFTGSGIGGCTSPTAAAGAMDYSSTTYRFCDGNGWVSIGK